MAEEKEEVIIIMNFGYIQEVHCSPGTKISLIQYDSIDPEELKHRIEKMKGGKNGNTGSTTTST